MYMSIAVRQLVPTPVSQFYVSDCLSTSELPTPTHNVGGFDRGECYLVTKAWLENNATGFSDACMRILFKNASIENPTPTIVGCTAFCGKNQGWYTKPDALERVLTWIFPIFFLLFNLNLPAIGWEKFFAITHALGDPIDSVWSLLDKMYAWDKCYAFAEEFVTEEESVGGNQVVKKAERLERIKIIATTFAGIEEIVGHGPDSTSVYWEIATSLGLMKTTNFDEWRRAATTLVDDRTNDFVRTGLAIFLFAFQFFSEVVFDSDDVPPGGRLGSAMLLSWLIPLILISNILGGVASRRTCLRTIIRLVENTRRSQGLVSGQALGDQNARDWNDYFDKLYSAGVIYISRPHKFRVTREANGREKAFRIALPFFVTLIVIFGFIPAFYIHWMAAPDGFSCRHFWIIGVFFAWLISAVLTVILQYFTRYNYWVWLIILKDFIVGFGSVVMLSLSVAGLYNSCVCWSMSLLIGEASAYFPLNTKAIYALYGRTIYRYMIVSFLSAQLCFVLIVVILFRRGLWLWRYGEKPKRAVWNRLEGSWILGFLRTSGQR
ncbi:hypothetical protein TWF730_003367 [Orbilia blumenaviensis]|uniref:Uncharacterized protein n=1 Tax=Orbilia blumenaviensis TaxID=1796055 RepID=A0AAV9U6P9_9PEZI